MFNRIFIILILLSCGQRKVITPTGAVTKFEEFRSREKFDEDTISFYPGLSNPTLRPMLNEKMNLVANDFESLSKTEGSTASDYHEKIKIGLHRFDNVYLELDTEDRERVCHYFEELMDIVSLESSGGQLNKFMYGFDPAKE